MTVVWETQIRTGNLAGDQQMLDRVRRQYEPQGMQVHPQLMPGGGFHVRVVRPAMPPRPSYGGPAPRALAYSGPAPSAAPAITEGEERVRYLRKVYGLLLIGVVFAVGAGFLSTSTLLGTETFRLEHGQRIEVPILVALMLDNPATATARSVRSWSACSSRRSSAR